MGVLIQGYRRLTPREAYLEDGVEPHDPVTKEWIGDSCVVLFTNPRFPNASDHIPDRSVWNYTEKVHVISTMHSHYTQWREQLTRLVGHTPGRPGPFRELLDWSDCEGTLGPITCAKLAQDFKAMDHFAAYEDADFFFIYRNMRHAFEAAADQGAVTFS